MQVMRKFSESERNFLLYQNCLNAKFSENSYNKLLKKAKIAKEKERAAKEKALQKIEKLKKALLSQGIDPDKI